MATSVKRYRVTTHLPVNFKKRAVHILTFSNSDRSRPASLSISHTVITTAPLCFFLLPLEDINFTELKKYIHVYTRIVVRAL